jgi:hypothetical protein
MRSSATPAAVAAAGWILLAGDRPRFDLPVAARAVADSHWVFVPSGQRFAVEQFDPAVGRGGIGQAVQWG